MRYRFVVAIDESVTELMTRSPVPGIDVNRVAALREQFIGPGTKGLPLASSGMTVDQYARSGIEVLKGAIPMPAVVLKQSVLESNIAAMQAYCDSHGVLLCPHGKTTMAPQLFQKQLEAGAWGFTAATPTHLRLYRDFGVDRIFYANQLVEPTVIAWLAAEVNRCPSFEFYCLVDSVESVHILDRHLGQASAQRTVGVLVEVGHHGGRCGVRDRQAAIEVASAIRSSGCLSLAGVEGFEGLLQLDVDDLSRVDDYLDGIAETARVLAAHGYVDDPHGLILTAGGSAVFDRVIEKFVGTADLGADARVVLRSGCYVTQDGGFYSRTSPLAGRCEGQSTLFNALEVWSVVLSRPESGLIITSMGKRDCSYDWGMPRVNQILFDGGGLIEVHDAEVVALSDQHAHVKVPATTPARVGDLVCATISHPCSTFDRWRLVPVVDDDYVIVDAIVTAF